MMCTEFQGLLGSEAHHPVPTGQGFFSCGFLWERFPHIHFDIRYRLNSLTTTVWNMIHSEPLPRRDKYPCLPRPPSQRHVCGAGVMAIRVSDPNSGQSCHQAPQRHSYLPFKSIHITLTKSADRVTLIV